MDNSVILSTAYFPPVEYFAQMLHHDHIFIEAFENYNKQTYRNRCAILSSNGKLDLSIPFIHGKGEKIPIKKLEISDESNWQLQHWRTIESAYSSSPFFIHYEEIIHDLIFSDTRNLFELNYLIIGSLMRTLRIPARIQESKSFEPDPKNMLDLRFRINPPRKQYLCLNIPSNEGMPYFQVFFEKFGFVPRLSILDLLFNKGPDTITYLREMPVANPDIQS